MQPAKPQLPPGVKPLPAEWVKLLQIMAKNAALPPNYVTLSHDMEYREEHKPADYKTINEAYTHLVKAQNALWRVTRYLQAEDYNTIDNTLQLAKNLLDEYLNQIQHTADKA
jgi:hypothetical protein